MEPSIQNPRRAPRVALRFRVDVVQGGRSFAAVTQDVGPGGCLLAVPAGLLPRQGVELLIHGTARRDTLVVSGSVVWAREGLAGVAFAPPASVAAAWFRRVMKARPDLEAALARIPDQIGLDAALFALPPDAEIHVTNDEAVLVRSMEHGIRVGQLLARCGLPAPRASRTIFALLDKRVLTLSVGEAAEPWRWRAVLQGRTAAPQEEPAAAPPATSAAAVQPAAASGAGCPVAARRLERSQRAAAGDLHAMLRGVGTSYRPPDAQAALDDARAAASAGQITRAVTLVRQALRLAPRDGEIAKLLGELAFSRRAA